MLKKLISTTVHLKSCNLKIYNYFQVLKETYIKTHICKCYLGFCKYLKFGNNIFALI